MALQAMGKIASAVRQRELGSDLYDRPLLKHFSAWGGLFKYEIRSVDLPFENSGQRLVAHIDRKVAVNAQTFSDQTPLPLQARVVSKLDMVRHSTRSFGLLLDSGDEVRGVLIEGTSELLQGYFGKEITVLGKAVYRPSGTLLRLDAHRDLSHSKAAGRSRRFPSHWFNLAGRNGDCEAARSGVVSFFGTWPGDETDQDLLDALNDSRLSESYVLIPAFFLT